MTNLLIKCRAVLTMDGPEGVIQNGEIAIQGNRIYHVGAAGSTPGNFQAHRVLEYPQMLALPGFINCHTHAAMTLFRGYADDMPLMSWLQDKIWPLEEHLTPDDIYQGTILACAEMVRGGTTTFADMYFAMDQVARAVDQCGMRAVLCRGMIGFGPGAETALQESREFIQQWQGGAGGRITVRFGPHAPYTCAPDYLKRVAAAADELGVGIHIHLAETLSEVQEIREKYGKTPVLLMEDIGLLERPVLAAHCVHLDQQEIEILARRQVGVAHNPQSNMKLASGTAPVTSLLAAGATVGLGTDGAASNNNLDLMEEMRTAALLHKLTTGDAAALPAYQVLSMATAQGARALGLENEVGRLKAGLKADLILLDLHKPHLYPIFDYYTHVVYAAAASDVDTVIVDGQVVMENRRLLLLDEDSVLADTQRVAMDLVQRSKG